MYSMISSQRVDTLRSDSVFVAYIGPSLDTELSNGLFLAVYSKTFEDWAHSFVSKCI